MTMASLLVGLVMIAAGVLVGGMGVLGRLGRLPRNGLVGIRIPSTLASGTAWERAHRASWIPTTLAGVVTVAAGIVAMAVRDEQLMAGIVLGACIVLLALVLVAAAIAGRAARRSD